ncbi:inhibin alpha chain [Narcine bancroftii]|uniref:inhibin alpha chain n=1 Tax=Narcine bancroftii TaxID=1343680 RepID=UPI003831F753
MSLTLLASMRPIIPLHPLLLLFLVPWHPGLGASCPMHSFSEDAILAKVQEKILQSLGLAETPQTCNQSLQETRNPFRNPRLEQHLTQWMSRRPQDKDDDKSEVISFPVTSVSCDVEHQELVGDHSYVFQPSLHSRGRLVTSAEFWFHTGLSVSSLVASTKPLAQLHLLVEDTFVRAAKSVVVDRQWAVFHVFESFLPHIVGKVVFLRVKCPGCRCVSDPANMPFLLSATKASRPARSRRSTVPWSPAYVDLLQRSPSSELIHDGCQRSAVNISFEDLGWGNWIVQPRSFTFYYCNGTCSDSNRLTSNLGVRMCCASIPDTMKPLRVRTTSDGGLTFKYEAIASIITGECACF